MSAAANPTSEALADVRAYMADGLLPITPTMAAFDRRQAMWRENPLLALAYWAEALGDRRTETDVSAMAALGDLRSRALEVIERVTGSRANPMFPDPAIEEADGLKRRFAALHDQTINALTE